MPINRDLLPTTGFYEEKDKISSTGWLIFAIIIIIIEFSCHTNQSIAK